MTPRDGDSTLGPRRAGRRKETQTLPSTNYKIRECRKLIRNTNTPLEKLQNKGM
jgi:hypothetical protein